MEIQSLEGRAFGPYPLRFCREKVAEFTHAIGSDAERWVKAAPPAFLALSLFVVAPDLLDLLEGHTVIHGDQSFSWSGPFELEQDVLVGGTVSKVRERAGTFFVTFDLTVEDGVGGLVADGSSLFLVSPSTPDDGADPSAPRHGVEDDGAPGPGQRSASRSDLVRYAAASRDWNPIHWDHGTALRAGLDGVVVHGLLQAAWALDGAATGTSGLRPFATAKFRFKNPLPPATPVDVIVDTEALTRNVTLSAGETTFLTARVEVAEE